MSHTLKEIDIIGLHGVRDYHITLKDNKLIIVGENGSGKTTVFKIIYHTLSCDWDSLRTFEFEEIDLFFDADEKITVTSELLESIFAIKEIDRVVFYADGRPRNRRVIIDDMLNSIIQIKSQFHTEEKNEMDRPIYSPVPVKYIQEVLNEPDVERLYKISQKIMELFDAQILYLPTYRRIEEQLKNIFPYMDSDEWSKARKQTKIKRAIELVEFGMADVERSVKECQKHLGDFSRAHQNKLTLGYLSEIISKKYEQVDVEEIRQLSDEQISTILYRIESNILPEGQKKEILSILTQVRDKNIPPKNVQEKIICHYFLNLMEFNREISSEEAGVQKFRDKCNKYLVSNELVYDNLSFSCKVFNKTAEDERSTKEIQFQNLSSGEKQIVSLFSHLNLTQRNRVFVFIDEPELSLSVDWQRMFLVDILDSANCVGLIATTHSPFVFENELEEYVHGINEFCVRG